MRCIRVQIDRLVLKGFRHEDRRVVAVALQEEMTKLLAVPGMAERLAQVGSTPRLRIGNVNIAANAKPHEIGAETGRTIGRGLVR
jgi:hypothetical protein